MKREALSREGYIVWQALLTDLPYGQASVAKCGCGYIACYNLLKHCALAVPESDIKRALLRHSLFRGRLGTSPFKLHRFLKQFFPDLLLTLGKQKSLDAAKGARLGVVLYRHSGGLHYVSFFREDAVRFRFLNATAGTAPDVLTMEQFLAERCLWPTVLVWYVA